MSRLWPSRLLAATIATGALTLASVPAGGQTRARLEERIAALTVRLSTLSARLDSLRNADDTIRLGRVGFVVAPEHRAAAERAARAALDTLARTLGPRDVQLLDGWVSTALRRWDDESGERAVVARVLRAAGEDRLQRMSTPELRRWNRWWNPEPADLGRAYLDLVTTPSQAARGCFAGEFAACAPLLGIEPVDDAWTRLLDAADRRAWVAHRMRWSPLASEADRWRERRARCVDGRDDEACLDLLRALGEPRRLVSAEAGRSLLLVARDLGGDGFFTRLLADSLAPFGSRLAAAAGVPRDSLLRTWHARMLAAAPPPSGPRPAVGWTSFMLALALGGIALRSTQWR